METETETGQEIQPVDENEELQQALRGVYLDVEDIDEYFHSLSSRPVIANEWSTDDVSSRAELNDLLMTRYDTESLEATPTCECGHTTVPGIICQDCGTEAIVPAEKPIESKVWIKAPDGVLGLINPTVWNILSKLFKKDNNDILTWLVDPYYRPPSPRSEWLRLLSDAGVERGLNYFIANFDAIMEILLSVNGFTSLKKAELARTKQWIAQNRHKFFPQHLPIPCKITFIIESLDIGAPRADLRMRDALDAMRTIQGLYSGIDTQPSLQLKEARAAKASIQLASFYFQQYKHNLSSKGGWFRRHVFGSRPAFSFRAVITSISRPHRYDDCHLPWSLAISLFKMHLHNKLAKLGYTPKQATQFITDSMIKYNDKMSELLDQLIAEAPGRGPVVVLQRNPSLQRLSAQRLFVTAIIKDPDINAMCLSVLVLKGPNEICSA